MYETVYVYVSKTTAIYSHAHVKIAKVNKHNTTFGLLCIVVIVVLLKSLLLFYRMIRPSR